MDAPHRLNIRTIDSCDEFYDLRAEWNKILSTLREMPPFLTWEWMHTWWKIYKTKRTKLLVLVISDSTQVVAIAPLYIRTGAGLLAAKSIYFLGTGEPEVKEVCSEYLDFISTPKHAQSVSDMVLWYLTSNNNLWDRLEFHRILETSTLASFFINSAAEKYNVITKKCGQRYFINLPKTWDEYLRSLSSSMRRSILGASKKLQNQTDHKVNSIENGNEIKCAMQDLIKLHTESWEMKGKPGAFASREFCEFHLKIAELMHKNNMLHMLKISISGEVIAVLYNYKIKDINYYYQSGLNMKRYSLLKPGILLHSEAIKFSINHKIEKYDFMMAGEGSYKKRYGCQTNEMFHITAWNKSFRAQLLHKLAQLPYFRSLK